MACQAQTRLTVKISLAAKANQWNLLPVHLHAYVHFMCVCVYVCLCVCTVSTSEAACVRVRGMVSAWQ